MPKIFFLQSHPIQYHSPLYDKLEQNSLIEFKIYYCSDYGLSKDGKRYHPEFGEMPNWDIDLVGGHTHEILNNNSLKKGVFKGFFGLMNFSVYNKLRNEKPDILVINGWNYFTMIWAVLCCKLFGIKVYVRGDNSIEGDRQLSKLKLAIKRLIYGQLLFPLYNRIGYVGQNNKAFFKSYGVKESSLIHLPHAVDNNKFNNYYKSNISKKLEIKSRLEIPDVFNILFVGRLHREKRILDIIEALKMVKESVHFTIIGDGKMFNDVKNACEALPNISYKLVGFKNQDDLMDYYLTGDLLVLPSQLETWGLVVNEAMNFNMPIILSDKVGCSKDLCQENNGYTYKMGDINSLSSYIELLVKNPNIAKEKGVESGKIIKTYSYDTIEKNLIESL